MENIRLMVVYVHLLAVCVALGLVLSSDFMMVKRMWLDTHGKHLDKDHLIGLQQVVFVCLAVLWITGAAICYIDWLKAGWHYFENPKLQVKIVMVVILTINGIILHRHVLPMLHKVDSLHHLSADQCAVACLFGAISGVTWLYAAFMGIARIFSWVYSFGELFVLWPVLVTLAYFSMLVLINHTRKE